MLAHVALADRDACGLAALGQCWKQDADEQRNDRNDDQDLNESESPRRARLGGGCGGPGYLRSLQRTIVMGGQGRCEEAVGLRISAGRGCGEHLCTAMYRAQAPL